jgi:hypothetical protein
MAQFDADVFANRFREGTVGRAAKDFHKRSMFSGK